MTWNVRLSTAVTEWLKKEHLAGWLEPPIASNHPEESPRDAVSA
jgi:hypothetical protein